MRFDLDVVYFDRENRVVKVIKSLEPFKIALPAKNAVSTLEIPSGIVVVEMLQQSKN
jgi:uncharacterized membrane protein (UPF0127 family)